MANRSPYNERIRSPAVLLFAVAVLTGCVRTPPPDTPDKPPIATLPLSAAGVMDGREVFARNFSAELASSAPSGAKDTATWTHWRSTLNTPSEPVPLPGGVSVLIVPGIFGDCVADQSLPFSDGVARTKAANIEKGYAYLASFGLHRIQAISVRGRASSAANGAVIAAAIRKEAQDPGVSQIVVVGYSKGVPDTLHALERLSAEGFPKQALSFVSLSGVVMGTSVADDHEELYGQLATRFEGLECTPSDGEELTSLTTRERQLWLAEHPHFPGINLYTVVAFAKPEAISPGLLPFYRRLAIAEPRNDGQVVRANAVLPDSTLLAEVNSDHWTYVLPLRGHPNWLVRTAAVDRYYPRAEFFRALVRTVVELNHKREKTK